MDFQVRAEIFIACAGAQLQRRIIARSPLYPLGA